MSPAMYFLLWFVVLSVGPGVCALVVMKLLEPSRAAYRQSYYVDFPVHDHGQCYSLPYNGVRMPAVIDE